MAWNGEDIYRKHAEGVYRYLFSLCGEADTAEELTQETFCQALKGLGTFRGGLHPRLLAVRHCKAPVVQGAGAPPADGAAGG